MHSDVIVGTVQHGESIEQMATCRELDNHQSAHP